MTSAYTTTAKRKKWNMLRW